MIGTMKQRHTTKGFIAGDNDPTVLFVDDEPDLLELAKRALHRAGFQVTCAASGEEALHRLAERSYDVFVVDLRMPKPGGREIYQSIQEHYPHLAQRTVFITGELANNDWPVNTGLTILTKPFDLGQLVAVVRSTLEQDDS